MEEHYKDPERGLEISTEQRPAGLARPSGTIGQRLCTIQLSTLEMATTQSHASNTLECSKSGMKKKARTRLCRTFTFLRIVFSCNKKRIPRKDSLYKYELVYHIKVTGVQLSRVVSTMPSLPAFSTLLSGVHCHFFSVISGCLPHLQPLLLCFRQLKWVMEMEKGLWAIQSILSFFPQYATCFPGTFTQGRLLSGRVFVWSRNYYLAMSVTASFVCAKDLRF